MSIFIEDFVNKLDVDIEVTFIYFPYYLFDYHIYNLGLQIPVFFILAFVDKLYDGISNTGVVSQLNHPLQYFRSLFIKLVEMFGFNSDDCVEHFYHVVYTIFVRLFFLYI